MERIRRAPHRRLHLLDRWPPRRRGRPRRTRVDVPGGTALHLAMGQPACRDGNCARGTGRPLQPDGRVLSARKLRRARPRAPAVPVHAAAARAASPTGGCHRLGDSAAGFRWWRGDYSATIRPATGHRVAFASRADEHGGWRSRRRHDGPGDGAGDGTTDAEQSCRTRAIAGIRHRVARPQRATEDAALRTGHAGAGGPGYCRLAVQQLQLSLVRAGRARPDRALPLCRAGRASSGVSPE